MDQRVYVGGIDGEFVDLTRDPEAARPLMDPDSIASIAKARAQRVQVHERRHYSRRLHAVFLWDEVYLAKVLSHSWVHGAFELCQKLPVRGIRTQVFEEVDGWVFTRNNAPGLLPSDVGGAESILH